MNMKAINLVIIDDNVLTTAGLRNHLNSRFGNEISISTFQTGRSALREIDRKTDLVILDYFLEGENGNEILRAIKILNPGTQVIMFSSNEDIAVAIDSFRGGASDYVLKGDKAWKKISSLVYRAITYPVRVMVREFGVNTYLSMFLVTFLVMGCGLYLALKFIP
ncbi:MAG TPA: response regulator [Bacteroidia bacterium]|nr:response regulator [Bacteroidia bacterium]